jgi:hypothetical protein
MAAAAPESKDPAMCLLTGNSSQMVSPLVINHAAGEDTHTHTVMLQPDAEGSMLKSITTSPETLAHQYGCAPGALDLCGFTGIKIHGGTTTHMGPVGISITTTNPVTGDFEPLQTLTRSCFQSQRHTDNMDEHDAGQMCHYICNSADVGYVHRPVELKLHESQTADNMATNLCLRQMRWPKMPMTPEDGYTTVLSDTHGEMAAIPMQAPAQCNVSYLLQTNEGDLQKIAGPSAKIVDSTSGKFAMVAKPNLEQIKTKLAESFKTKSLFNNGYTINMFPLNGKKMSKDCVTTLTYSFMKNPKPLCERAANVMDAPAASMIERVHFHSIPWLLGEGDEPTKASMVSAIAPTATELSAELQSLVNGK